MTDIATVPVDAPAPPRSEGMRWFQRHLAWERTMRDCVEHALDPQLQPQPQPQPETAQSTDGTSAHNRSSS